MIEEIKKIIESKKKEMTSPQIAQYLNTKGYRTQNNKRFSAATVYRYHERGLKGEPKQRSYTKAKLPPEEMQDRKEVAILVKHFKEQNIPLYAIAEILNSLGFKPTKGKAFWQSSIKYIIQDTNGYLLFIF